MKFSHDKFITPATEKWFFFLLLALSLVYVWLQPAFITMDGPAHLYNSSLLKKYAYSEFIRSFLNRNQPLLPNYLTHLLLQWMLPVFDFQVAEKILVSLIVLLLPLSFRWLIVTYTKEVPFFSFLIFPLVFTNLLQLGFFNFSLGLIFFNLHLVLTAKTAQSPDEKKWWVFLFINTLPLYFCHLFGYALAFLVAGTWMIWTAAKEKKSLLGTLLKFIAVHLPTMIFASIFVRATTIPTYKYDLEPFEKILGIITFSPAILFEKRTEMLYTILIPILL